MTGIDGLPNTYYLLNEDGLESNLMPNYESFETRSSEVQLRYFASFHILKQTVDNDPVKFVNSVSRGISILTLPFANLRCS